MIFAAIVPRFVAQQLWQNGTTLGVPLRNIGIANAFCVLPQFWNRRYNHDDSAYDPGRLSANGAFCGFHTFPCFYTYMYLLLYWLRNIILLQIFYLIHTVECPAVVL